MWDGSQTAASPRTTDLTNTQQRRHSLSRGTRDATSLTRITHCRENSWVSNARLRKGVQGLYGKIGSPDVMSWLGTHTGTL